MPYTMADLEARSGLSARTIREYMRLGYLSHGRGHGPGATYDEDHMLRIVTIARMRAQGEDWEAVAGRLAGSLQSLRAFVRKTEPSKPPPPAPLAETSAAPPVAGEPVRRKLPPDRSAPAEELETSGEDSLDALPGGTHFVMAPLLPGLVLMVDRDAPPLVKRVAAEILARYRVTR